MYQEHHEEMPFARTLTIDTKGESIFNDLKEFLIAFPSSYLVERDFSAVANLLTKKRNRLDITNREDLRLNLTKVMPNVQKLLLQHQVPPSH
ncbi:uncharacterized protein TNCV_2000451 [Trichonephila clavipes]|nr:uncharacterized protein TNCV_2000451 [Trichonephila clavipes]